MTNDSKLKLEKQFNALRTTMLTQIDVECERLGGREKASFALNKEKAYFSKLLSRKGSPRKLEKLYAILGKLQAKG